MKENSVPERRMRGGGGGGGGWDEVQVAVILNLKLEDFLTSIIVCQMVNSDLRKIVGR